MASLNRLFTLPLSLLLLPGFLLFTPAFADTNDGPASVRPEGGTMLPHGAASSVTTTGDYVPAISPRAVTVNITETARLETNVLSADVFVDGSLAYIADEEIGIRILDVSDPANTFEVGSAPTPGAASSIITSGSLALVTDAWFYPVADYGLRIFDISVPSSPIMIGNVDILTEVHDVIIHGSYAIVAADSSGAIIIDISIPSSPVIVGTADTAGDAYSVAVSGNHLYVADGGFSSPFGIRVFDISNPTLPAQVGNLDLVDDAWDIKIDGNHAYVANAYGGLKVVDISDPMLPAVIGTLDTPDRALDIEISGSTAFIADYNTGLVIADISNPALPVLVNTMDTGVPVNLSLSGNFVHIADYFAGHKIIDASDIIALVDAGGLSAPGVFTKLASNGTNAYLADMNLGFRSIDTTAVNNPVLLNNEPVGSSIPGFNFSDIFAQSNRVFVAGPYTVDIFDTTLPQSPVHLGNFNGSFISDIDVTGDLVYASDRFDFRIVDVTSPATPVSRGVLALPGSARSIAVSGSTAVAGYGSNVTPGFDKSGFMLIDVSNPDIPVEITRIDLSGGAQPFGSVEDVAIIGDRLYAVAIGIGMLVYDISNPAVPVELGRLDTISIFSGTIITIDGDYAYLVISPENGSGIDIVDISDPTMPLELGQFLTYLDPQDIEVINNVIFLADRRGSLRIATIEFTPEPVAGTVAGLYLKFTFCKNLATATTGLDIVAGADTAWSCTDNGFTATSGDTAFAAVFGVKTLSPDPVSGTVTGLSPLVAICSNTTTATQVIVPLGGSTSWDCEAGGLIADPGDAVRIILFGNVP